MADPVHGAGGLVVATTPVPLGTVESARRLWRRRRHRGGESLGVPQSFGGPYVGLLARASRFVRQMPGRLAGIDDDFEGKRGFVLTLQTREQHIRREKPHATSAPIRVSWLLPPRSTWPTLGPEGFREVAHRSYPECALSLERAPGDACGVRSNRRSLLSRVRGQDFPVLAREINARLLEAGIIGGFDLSEIDPGLAIISCFAPLN